MGREGIVKSQVCVTKSMIYRSTFTGVNLNCGSFLTIDCNLMDAEILFSMNKFMELMS